ncbi:MAG: aldehyde dehydrogenase [Myxococcales bacterium FL481]|nr:MAG: aldehyde dehydrogenase [Myxococcales bacterium FL481]
MTPLRVGINGLGRVGLSMAGLAVLRARDPDHPCIARSHRSVQLVAIRDERSIDELADRLRHRWPAPMWHGDVRTRAGQLCIDDHPVAVLSVSSGEPAPWVDAGVEVVVGGGWPGATPGPPPLERGRYTVVLGGEARADATIVPGANDSDLAYENAVVVSAAGPCEHAFAPVLAALHRAFGVRWASVAHTLALDPAQPTHERLDGHELLDTRSGPANIVPRPTDALGATLAVLPDLAGRIEVTKAHVPVMAGSMFSITCTLADAVDIDRVLTMFGDAATNGPLRGIIRVAPRPMVSGDVVGDPSSCVIDPQLCRRLGPFLRVGGWFDENTGYAARLLDLAAVLGANRREPA